MDCAPSVMVLAGERDITADGMMRALDQRRISAVRVDTAWFPQQLRLAAEFSGGRWTGELDTGHRRVSLEALRSIWYRSPGAFQLDDRMSSVEQHWAAGEARYGLGGVLAALPVRWVNHPSRLADAAYKPVQLSVAARCGLRVPDTAVTNDAHTARAFAGDGETVSKALGAAAVVEAEGRSVAFTRRLDVAPDVVDLAGIEQTAHQLQRWVPKAHEARLIAVGERLFAAEIHAGCPAARIDWRADYGSLTYRPVDPPPDVTAGVARYLTEMGLLYGAFDFVVQPDGQWVFLECNAGGQYGFIERAIDAPITEALADLLSGEAA